MIKIFFVLAAFFSGGFHAAAQPSLSFPEGPQLLQEISTELQNLSHEEQQNLHSQMRAILDLSGLDQWSLRPMSTGDRNLRPFVCTGSQIAAGFSGLVLKCVSMDGQTFEAMVFGIRRALIVSGNVALGFTRGPVRKGSFKMSLDAGLFAGVGASVFTSPEISLLAPGIGLGFHLPWGSNANVLMGGEITVLFPEK